MEGLKPCPFCNGEGKVRKVNIGTEDAWLPFANHKYWCPMSCMTFNNCNAYTTREGAIKIWNTRA